MASTSERGTCQPVPRTTSAIPSTSRTASSRPSASSSSPTYMGLPLAPATSSRSAGPGGAPSRCATSPATAVSASGPSGSGCAPCETRLRTSPAVASVCRVAVVASTSSSGCCARSRPSRCSTTALDGSIHCASSSTIATGPRAHQRSIRSRIVSVTANSCSAAAAAPRPSRATPSSSSSSWAGDVRQVWKTAKGSRRSSPSARPRTIRIRWRAHSATTRSSMRVLPIPGSPSSTAAAPCPAAACRTRSVSRRSSASRPKHCGAVSNSGTS